MRRRFAPLAALLTALVATGVGAGAQGDPASTLFRVFLRDGQALPSYGDFAVVADRLVFTLAVGDAASPRLQLMSVPVANVDLDRTAKYSRSVRATHYAATRGEADYAAMTGEVSSAIEQLQRIDDPKRRLAVAEEAKRRLLAWSAENFSYRAKDIQQLAGLFDEVIAELRAAAGLSSFALELSTGPVVPELPPVLATPSLKESVELALGAAKATDLPEERLAILRAAFDAATSPEVLELRTAIGREILAESTATAAYAEFAQSILARAERAAAAGNVQVFSGMALEIGRHDEALGRRRPDVVRDLKEQISALLERAVARRLDLDRFALARERMVQYELDVRPALAGLDGLRPIVEHIRDQKAFGFERLEIAIRRLARLAEQLQQVEPPEDVADLHATFVSAFHMAAHACDQRRLAVITAKESHDREASAAAAGSLLLLSDARRELLTRMFPPRAK
ncbi:MAG TPA: hypothetical protein VFO19_05790 [Vicinamibacterales bacterium]|nr:hypothetical protein [Vicinamibacterales bacterium]